ncbi:MAG TPA: hypothetical protein VEL51_23575 [Vicinamibacterales bacterium]|nr:hypothetical protein [Vicinamibacterales bacterium]
MTDDLLTTLLPAMDIAVFSRRTDGSFSPITPTPEWFRRLADVTFPFLGHILEEASEFWGSGVSGSREYGPCAELDETGREFHYRVRALTTGEQGSQFLVFELDPGSDHLRDALQKAREQALVAERDHAAQREAVADIRKAVLELMQLLKQLPTTGPQGELTRTLAAKCTVVLRSTDPMAG